MKIKKIKIGVIGAGSWGTTVANLLAENGHKTTIWAFEKETAEDIEKNRRNAAYLPGIELNEKLAATSDLSDLDGSDIFVVAVPVQHIRAVLLNNSVDFKDSLVVNLSKGIETSTLSRVSQILKDAAALDDKRYVVLSGPSHAEETSRKMPTAVTAASKNKKAAKLIQDIFSNDYFRVYTSKDVVGCELGGALKNVIAIAAGILDGMNLGDNTKAALITRGLAGIAALGVAMGASPLTFSGLSGLGDLVVTCASRHSRNRQVGERIGKGEKLDDILANMKMVAEGVETAKSAYRLAKKFKTDLPIVEQVYKILFENKPPKEAIKGLMSRKRKDELHFLNPGAKA